MSTVEFDKLLGRAVFDARGERIGQLTTLYIDPDTGAVSFGGVGMLRRGRRRIVLVPLIDATIGSASITVKCGKELARRAPSVRPGQMLPAEAEPGLFAHYDIPHVLEPTERRLTPRT